MTTQVISDYIVNPFAQTAANLALMIPSTVIPLDPSYFILTSTSLTSDVTSVVGGKARRRLTINLQQPPIQLSPGNTTATQQYSPVVFSTSPNDTLAGTGAQTIQLQYFDVATGFHTENINLAGKTPVQAAGVNYFRLSGFTIIAAGADLANDGIIYVQAPTYGAVGAALLPGKQPGPLAGQPAMTTLAIVDASFYVKNPGGLATWPKLFQNWLGAALKARVGPVVEIAPVFS